MVVLQARQALDRTGANFAAMTDDVHVHKAGLWLLEMVKAGAGVLDRGTDAVINYTEIARPKANVLAGRGLFYGTAARVCFGGVRARFWTGDFRRCRTGRLALV